MLSTFHKFWNLYYLIGPALWKARPTSLLLYSSRSRDSCGMISRVRQHHSLKPDIFLFRKNIMSVNLRGVAVRHHRCFISLMLTGEIVDVEVRLYVYGQVLSEDYEWRDTWRNFFQFYCLCNGEKREFYTTFPKSVALSYLNRYYLLCKNI